MTPQIRGSSRRYDVAFYVPSIGPLLTTEAVDPAGGAETQVVLVARALARRGVRVCLVAYEQKARLPERIDGIDVVARPPYNAQKRLVGKFREAAAIRRIVPSLDAEVVVTRAAGPNVGLLMAAARLARSRFVYSSANVVDFDFGRICSKRRDVALYRLGLRHADDLIVQTDEQAELCVERLGRTPAVIRSIAERPDVSERRSPRAFLWIGRLVWYKQPLAFVELARSLPHARFWIVGVPVPGQESLSDQVRAAAAEVPNLEVLPPRPRTQLGVLMRDAVAIVNTADFEGMPNVFLEGWARGVPALALSHDPDGVIQRNDLGVFAAGSVAELAAGARKLWDERDALEGTADRCRRYVADHHSEDVVGAQWQHALGIRTPISDTVDELVGVTS
jgi:glycosyltransferase involved in cell wall biosynthesis